MYVLLTQSCNLNSQVENKIEKQNFDIDFFDEKYFHGYQSIIDESNISDHPFFSYLDCSKDGYFAVHFIPKEQELHFFRIENTLIHTIIMII